VRAAGGKNNDVILSASEGSAFDRLKEADPSPSAQDDKVVTAIGAR
jgi:hypothetical protein